MKTGSRVLAGIAICGVILFVIAAVLLLRICACAEYRQIKVTGAPPKSRVYVDGRLRAITSENGSATVGYVMAEGTAKHKAVKVRISREGYHDFDIDVKTKDEKIETITAGLEPIN